MVKYVKEDTSVVFEELPDEISLALNISNCQNKCIGCHSPYLRGDVGDELTKDVIDKLISDNYGVTCVLFMGEGNDRNGLLDLAKYVRNEKNMKVGLYSGREIVEPAVFFNFDYVKIGPYIESFGPLNKRTTNQRLYKVDRNNEKSVTISNITEKFWKDGD